MRERNLSHGFQGQRTDEPKSPAAPDNLLAPLPGYDRVEGDFVTQEQPMRIIGPLSQNKAAQWVLAGTALGAVALLAGRSRRDGR